MLCSFACCLTSWFQAGMWSFVSGVTMCAHGSAAQLIADEWRIRQASSGGGGGGGNSSALLLAEHSRPPLRCSGAPHSRTADGWCLFACSLMLFGGCPAWHHSHGDEPF